MTVIREAIKQHLDALVDASTELCTDAKERGHANFGAD